MTQLVHEHAARILTPRLFVCFCLSTVATSINMIPIDNHELLASGPQWMSKVAHGQCLPGHNCQQCRSRLLDHIGSCSSMSDVYAIYEMLEFGCITDLNLGMLYRAPRKGQWWDVTPLAWALVRAKEIDIKFAELGKRQLEKLTIKSSEATEVDIQMTSKGSADRQAFLLEYLASDRRIRCYSHHQSPSSPLLTINLPHNCCRMPTQAKKEQQQKTIPASTTATTTTTTTPPPQMYFHEALIRVLLHFGANPNETVRPICHKCHRQRLHMFRPAQPFLLAASEQRQSRRRRYCDRCHVGVNGARRRSDANSRPDDSKVKVIDLTSLIPPLLVFPALLFEGDLDPNLYQHTAKHILDIHCYDVVRFLLLHGLCPWFSEAQSSPSLWTCLFSSSTADYGSCVKERTRHEQQQRREQFRMRLLISNYIVDMFGHLTAEMVVDDNTLRVTNIAERCSNLEKWKNMPLVLLRIISNYVWNSGS